MTTIRPPDDLDVASCVEAGSLRRMIQDDARVDASLRVAVVAAGKGEPEPAGLASFLTVEGFVKAFAWHGGSGTAAQTEPRLVAAVHHAHELVVEVLAKAPRWSTAKALHEMLREDGDLLGGPVVRQVIADYRERVRARTPATATVAGPLASATLTAIAIGDGYATVSRVGDCRAFHVRGDIVDALTPFDAPTAGTIGASVQDVPIATRTIATRPGDVFVLCSYGAWGALSNDAIRAAATLPSASDACGALVRATLASGGLDNIAVAVARL